MFLNQPEVGSYNVGHDTAIGETIGALFGGIWSAWGICLIDNAVENYRGYLCYGRGIG